MGPEEGKRSEERKEINKRNSLCLQPFKVRANAVILYRKTGTKQMHSGSGGGGGRESFNIQG